MNRYDFLEYKSKPHICRDDVLLANLRKANDESLKESKENKARSRRNFWRNLFNKENYESYQSEKFHNALSAAYKLLRARDYHE